MRGRSGRVRAACRGRPARWVKISTPASVTPTMCSNWADRLRSRVTAVQPSSSTFTSGPAGVDHRLDGEEHAGPQHRPVAGAAEMQHVRRLVEAPADAVAAEIAHHGEPVAPRRSSGWRGRYRRAWRPGGPRRRRASSPRRSRRSGCAPWWRRRRRRYMRLESPCQPSRMTVTSMLRMSPSSSRRSPGNAVADDVVDRGADRFRDSRDSSAAPASRRGR